jgi:hypothetical protein
MSPTKVVGTSLAARCSQKSRAAGPLQVPESVWHVASLLCCLGVCATRTLTTMRGDPDPYNRPSHELRHRSVLGQEAPS